MLNQIECYIDGYDVLVTVVPEVAGPPVEPPVVEFTFMDSCLTMRDDCRLKAVLLKAASDYFVANDPALGVALLADCCGEKACCPGIADSVGFVGSEKKLKVYLPEGTDVSGYADAVTGRVSLPYCDTTVVFA